MKKLTVLGGSSPFTVALIDALAARSGSLPPVEVCLVGRDADALDRVGAYGRGALSILGWKVTTTTELSAALAGSEIIVQQIRFGGPGGREDDEALAEKLGLVADETLGVSAVRRGLKIARPLRELGATIATIAPDALLLNLTNPLSLATSILSECGVARCIGVCELPWTTARDAARLVGGSAADLRWSYVGFNHRGFVTRLARDGEDLLARLIAMPPETQVLGIPVATIRSLGALPTKYFRFVLDPTQPAGRGRARYLGTLRHEILAELAISPNAPPPSLAERVTDWYEDALVPMIEGALGEEPREVIANVAGDDGLVREARAELGPDGLRIQHHADRTQPVSAWLDTFEEHERALLALHRRPTAERLRTLLELDPLVPERAVPAAYESLRPLLAPLAEATA